VPGVGPGEVARQALDDFNVNVVSDADHRASVDTPLGRFDIYTYTEFNEGREWTCEAMIGEFGGSAGCADGDLELPGKGEVRPAGSGSDGQWSTVEVRAGQGIAAVVANAADGTVYRSNVLDGFAVFIYPTRRGDLTLQGLGPEGIPIGPVVNPNGSTG
jgi:hypothetical protein